MESKGNVALQLQRKNNFFFSVTFVGGKEIHL